MMKERSLMESEMMKDKKEQEWEKYIKDLELAIENH
jgi:hypothetical protein